jgi:DNA-binding MarR family transcriptional regulator
MTRKRSSQSGSRNSRYRALAEFRYHIREYLHFSDQAAKLAGLEPKQYQLLLAVKGLPDDVSPTVSALAHQLRTRHHSTVELVNRAERNGLVKRSRSGSYVLVQLTKKGERTLARVVDKRLREPRRAGPVLVKALQQLINADELP